MFYTMMYDSRKPRKTSKLILLVSGKETKYLKLLTSVQMKNNEF